jgi:signal transduction histidine kinase
MTIDEGHRRLLEELGIRSYMAVPLRARNQTLGAITFASASRNFDEDHFSLALDLAGRAATALDNAALYESAQESNHAKSNFLGVMSHELRTPLTAILGYADLMLTEVTGPPPSTKQREHLERIKLRSLDLARIIDEILTFARLETGAEHPEPVAVDLTKVIREVTTEARPMVEEAGLEFRVHIPVEPLRVETDPKRIRYILTNLISNAVRFTEHGFVEVAAERENGRARIRVTDTGVGIEPRYHEHIFEPFFQVEKANTREKGGTGLGLAVARRAARLLGGDISLESAPGRGSTFTLDLFVGNGAKQDGG